MTMTLIIAALFFVIFVINVAVGSAGGPAFLSDIEEMLMLFAASVFFVAAILKKEAAAKGRNGSR